MKAGATYNLIVKLPEITDESSEQEIIDEIIFTINCGSVQLSKVYPNDVSLAGDIYIIPLNQAETKQAMEDTQSYGEQTKSELPVKLQDALNSINDALVGQLESINNIAQAQIDAINKTSQS